MMVRVGFSTIYRVDLMVTVGGIKIHCRNLSVRGLHPVRETSQHLTDSDNGSLRHIDKLEGGNKNILRENKNMFIFSNVMFHRLIALFHC